MLSDVFIYVTLSGVTLLLLTSDLFSGPESTFAVLLSLVRTHKLFPAHNSFPKVPVALQRLVREVVSRDRLS